MSWLNIGVLFLISNYVQGYEYRLEKFPGFRHDERVSASQAGCMFECSKGTDCCAFSFILGVNDVCHIYRNCAQQPGTYNVDELRVFYKKNAPASVPVVTQNPVPDVPTAIVPIPTTVNLHTTVTVRPPQNIGAADAVFSESPCDTANKSVFVHQYTNQPFSKLTNPWKWCPSCKEHADSQNNDKRMLFDQAFASYGWRFAVVANSKINMCDLLVECNLDYEFAKNRLVVNNKVYQDENTYVRITWDETAKHWIGKWTFDPDMPTIVTTIECR